MWRILLIQSIFCVVSYYICFSANFACIHLHFPFFACFSLYFHSSITGISHLNFLYSTSLLWYFNLSYSWILKLHKFQLGAENTESIESLNEWVWGRGRGGETQKDRAGASEEYVKNTLSAHVTLWLTFLICTGVIFKLTPVHDFQSQSARQPRMSKWWS